MRDQINKIKLGILLNDSKFISCTHPEKGDQIILLIQLKDSRLIEFKFKDLILFVYWNNDIYNFCINNSETDLFIKVLKKRYDYPNFAIPEDHPYHLYQFFNSNGMPSIEIGCVDYDFRLCLENNC